VKGDAQYGVSFRVSSDTGHHQIIIESPYNGSNMLGKKENENIFNSLFRANAGMGTNKAPVSIADRKRYDVVARI